MNAVTESPRYVNDVTSSTSLYLNLVAAFLTNISLVLLINEWLWLKESWTVAVAAGQQWVELIYLSLVTFLLLPVHWVSLLAIVRAIDERMAMDTIFVFRAVNIAVPEGF
jgi:hypothetical protein